MVWRMRKTIPGRGRGPWPVVVLLVLIVAVPTAWVLWFMNEALENQRLAVRQKLAEVHHGAHTNHRQQQPSAWESRILALSRRGENHGGSEIFKDIVESGLADGAVVVGQGGTPLYPATSGTRLDEVEAQPRTWQAARDLEFRKEDPLAAAAAYAGIAREADDADLAGQALLAEARCRAKAGQKDAAVKLLIGELASINYGRARTATGRLIQPDALLRGAQLLSGGDRTRFERILDLLVRRLRDYSQGDLPAGQRRFLMKQCRSLDADRAVFPTLAAEDLAAAYLESHGDPSRRTFGSLLSTQVSWLAEHGMEGGPFLQPCRIGSVWELRLPREGIVALFRKETILAEIRSMGEGPGLPPTDAVKLLPPGQPYEPSAGAVTLPADRPLAGWHFVLEAEAENALQGQGLVYLWMGLLFIASTLALAALMAWFLGRQLQLTRLKNDLVATVTHELKTPLASIRMLVDTLLDGRYEEQQTVREYLELIARENARLSRLIENFLTFSRMERGKRSFDLTPADAAGIARDAVEAVREKFEAAGFSLEVEIAPDLPEILADADALETVVLNLLDNAYKYSRQDRRVALRVSERGGQVGIEVEDHGIGMSPRAARKVFERFYQVDRSLSRQVGGCGLGLSIVRFVVDAHGGVVEVESRPGEGSRFTVRLPATGAGDREEPG